MAIDTAQKRMATLEVPSIMPLPFPSGVASLSNRMQLAWQYTGIAVVIDEFFMWRGDNDSSRLWCKEGDSSKVNAQDSNASTSWVKVNENPEK